MDKKQIIISVLILVILSSLGLIYYKKQNDNKNPADVKAVSKELLIKVALPKSKVNYDYYQSYQAMINEIAEIDVLERDSFLPILNEIKTKAESNDISGLGVSVQKLKNYNELNKKKFNNFRAYNLSLQKANQEITDAEIAELTNDVINTGKMVADAYDTRYIFTEKAISSAGTNLNQESVKEIKDIMDKISHNRKNFVEAVEKIHIVFNEEIKTNLEKAKKETETKK